MPCRIHDSSMLTAGGASPTEFAITDVFDMTAPNDGLFRDAMTTWMDLALEQARRALEGGEAPMGAVLLNSAGEMMATGRNTTRATGNPTTHAEMNAFGAAAGHFDGAHGLTLVSTLEPCVMCTGAAMQAGVTRIVFGLKAPADSGTSRVAAPSSPDATIPEVVGGIGAAESRAMFVEWMDRHDGDASRDEQRRFITELLTLTAGDTSAVTAAESVA
jgi:tRNA(adenine34) deaminase